MFKKIKRAAWTEIDLGNLDYNIKNIIAKAGPVKKIIGVIKADGYGHGAVKVAQVLIKNGIKSFAVATLQEAAVLREADISGEIIVLSLIPDMYASDIIKYDVKPVVCSFSNAKAISDAAASAGKTICGFIAVDTGMGRIGYLPDEPTAVPEIKKIDGLPGFTITGLFSHFATADSADKTYAKKQEEKYNLFYEKLIKNSIKIPERTIANSAAVMEMPSVFYDAVRPGIILYGCYPSEEVDRSQLDLKPVMSVKAKIIYLKKIPEGSTVSYGRKFTALRDSVIATLPLGYADGLPRPYSSKGMVIINGHYAKIAGNICMDQFMIDVTDVPNVKLGDEVIIMGSSDKKQISADYIADMTGTINYEIVCAFGQRLPKIYIK